MLGSYMRMSNVLDIPPGSEGSMFAECDAGDLASGGGFTASSGAGGLDVWESRPVAVSEDGDALEVPTSYLARAVNNSDENHGLMVYVVCLDLGS